MNPNRLTSETRRPPIQERKQDRQAALDAAYKKAKDALDNLPGCAGLFGSPTVFGTFNLTASGVLGILKESDSFRFSDSPNFPFKNGGVTTYDETVVGGVRVDWRASIVLDSALSDKPTDLMLTIIHETGHVMRELGYSGGDFIHNDGPNQPDNQQHNNDRIREECDKS
jgi:hypothetical protein